MTDQNRTQWKPFTATISKTFDFDAAHRLDLLPEDHKCHGMHGHTYYVEFILRGVVAQPLGMFMDYADIARAWEPLHKAIDHQCLNKNPHIGHPTTENLARYIVDVMMDDDKIAPFLKVVRVYESKTTYAEVLADVGIPF